MKNIEELLKEMTLEEKAIIVSGTNFMYTNKIDRLGIPEVCTSDGPHGLRKQAADAKDNGVSTSEPATSFPTAATTSSGWNKENLYKMGEAIGQECSSYNVDVLLGPGVNIKRNPLCGRNFEYFSEDPYLAGVMGSAHVKGVMSQHVDVSLKHFALNNSENYRFMGNSIVDEKTARNIYLKPFEMVVKEAKPKTVMCAYNQINGVFCSQNKWLLTDVLRDEWGFDGIVMSDWGASKDRDLGIEAGMELEMPGDTNISKKMIIDAVNEGRLSQEVLDKSVRRMLGCIQNCETNRTLRPVKIGGFDETMKDAHHTLASDIAKDCAVLLKNEDVLPLNTSQELLVVGELFDKMRYQGSGSSMINPTRLTTPRTAFDSRQVSYKFNRGYAEEDVFDEDLVLEAVKSANSLSNEGIILLFAGLTDYSESEGADRDTLSLPSNQLALINALIQTGKRIVVVLYGGSVIELPFADDVDAILNMFLPGQAGGEATASLLFGEVSPSGRLSETWVNCYKDVPFGEEFGKHINEIYKEGTQVGYRYYETNNIPVRYPFGYGLSYTSFSYDALHVEKTDAGLDITVSITNTGSMKGAEVVQCYINHENNIKELKAFDKVYLEPGETKAVFMQVPYTDLMYYEDGSIQFKQGTYHIHIMKNAHIDMLETKIELNDDIKSISVHPFEKEIVVDENTTAADLASMPITLESRFTDLNQTFMGKILFNSVLSVAKMSEKQAKKLPQGPERDNKLKGAIFLKRILESNSLRTMSMSAGQSFPYHMALGMRDMANGHILKGVKHMLSPVKVVDKNAGK